MTTLASKPDTNSFIAAIPLEDTRRQKTMQFKMKEASPKEPSIPKEISVDSGSTMHITINNTSKANWCDVALIQEKSCASYKGETSLNSKAPERVAENIAHDAALARVKKTKHPTRLRITAGSYKTNQTNTTTTIAIPTLPQGMTLPSIDINKFYFTSSQ